MRKSLNDLKNKKMKMIQFSKEILLLSIFFISSVSVLAQQVYPVQVSGAMVPPRSLDLGVYGTDRAQDLFFNVTLNDPVKPVLDITLSLSIEQNGDIIYQTDPNFEPSPTKLSQFQMLNVDGSMLQPYLNAANLINSNASGIGCACVQ